MKIMQKKSRVFWLVLLWVHLKVVKAQNIQSHYVHVGFSPKSGTFEKFHFEYKLRCVICRIEGGKTSKSETTAHGALTAFAECEY